MLFGPSSSEVERKKNRMAQLIRHKLHLEFDLSDKFLVQIERLNNINCKSSQL